MTGVEAWSRYSRLVHRRTLPVALTMLVALPACSSPTLRGGYCAPPSTAAFSLNPDPAPPDDAPHDAQVEALIGLGSVDGDSSATADRRMRVLERVELASLAIGATSAELDCEAERAQQAADYLTHEQTSRTQIFTIGSVVAATLTGIAGVLLSTNDASAEAQDSVAIGGGAVTAGLGLASLFVEPRTYFEHSRNLLADVWNAPLASTTFPPVVWTYLTRPAFSNARREAIRQKIVARWKQFRQVDDPSAAAILFGAGGSYDADALQCRAAMLDEVKAEVELARQDLAALPAALLR